MAIQFLKPSKVYKKTLLFQLSNFVYLLFFLFLAMPYTACEILVPQPGIKPMPPAVEAWSLNHWTTREVPVYLPLFLIFLNFFSYPTLR